MRLYPKPTLLATDFRDQATEHPPDCEGNRGGRWLGGRPAIQTLVP